MVVPRILIFNNYSLYLHSGYRFRLQSGCVSKYAESKLIKIIKL